MTSIENKKSNSSVTADKVISSQVVAKRLQKSRQWVYNNAASLGAVKIGGSWIFTERGLKDALQGRKEVEGDPFLQGNEASDKIVLKKIRCPGIRAGDKGGSRKEL
ncbi:hypothetical protein ACFL2O_10755, partial [Thermodesulfobacteriota bacterium]